jgi:hypothetical protein
MKSEATDMMVENVKIDKQFSWRPTLAKSTSCDYYKNAIVIAKRT